MFEVVADLGFSGKYDIFHNTDALDMFDKVRDCNNKNPKTQVILLQTVSGDLMMNAGIAKQINNRYGFKDYVFRSLIRQGVKCNVQNHQLVVMNPLGVGTVVRQHLINGGHGDIYALVTKDLYYNKPSLCTMRAALIHLAMREVVYGEAEDYIIVMPAIGCGLDRMKWEDVYYILQDAFADVDNVKFVICFKEGNNDGS
jgi:hypothetical protein